ncbi:DUF3179 domain-containing (seleno)protein [Polaribacter uvawellassae]|uniref:DUF3179 domain-containing (seleno)protein n=1 Tax=Polaribacter uvawellassae TaxID=3133495 RepID=UPI003219587D
MLSACTKNSLEEIKVVTEESPWINVEKPYPTGEIGLFPLHKNPIYKAVNEFSNLKDDDKVAIVSYQNKIKVYPYVYTNKYEIVNDSIGDYFYAVSYCPQTKSAINFNRIVQNDTLDLVASGYLYKDNMVPSDKDYKFFWSQMQMQGITKDADFLKLKTLNLIQTNWKTVVDFFPNAQVYYYKGEIATPKNNNNSIKLKTSAEISNADPVFSIIENFDESAKEKIVHSYAIKDFSNDITLQELILNSEKTLLIGSKKHYFFTTFIVPNELTFKLENNNFPPTLIDNEGTKWNAFGYAFEGPKKGQQLASAKSYVASWWAWKVFFTTIEIK